MTISLPRLIRPGEAPEGWRVTTSSPENRDLLLTDELRNKAEEYLETGDPDLLIDVRELAAHLAASQGIDAEGLERLADGRRARLGTYGAGAVLHPPQADLDRRQEIIEQVEA